MAYIRCSEQVHRAVKREAADTGLSMQELAARAWGAYQRERAQSGIPSNVIERTTKGSNDKEGEIPYSGEALKTLASEISERAAAILQIAEKGKVPTIGKSTGVSAAKLTTADDLSARTDRVAADSAEILDDVAEIKEQFGGAERGRKRAHRKVSNG